MRVVIIISIFLVTLIGGGFFVFSPRQVRPLEINQPFLELAINTARIKAEVARTPPEHQRGLSGRTSLPTDSGLLFVFDQPGYYYFWMKDMLFPIDIIWIDEAGQVVEITPNLTPETYPQNFTSREPAHYVLEVSAGFAEQHDIIIGDVLEGLPETYP